MLVFSKSRRLNLWQRPHHPTSGEKHMHETASLGIRLLGQIGINFVWMIPPHMDRRTVCYISFQSKRNSCCLEILKNIPSRLNSIDTQAYSIILAKLSRKVIHHFIVTVPLVCQLIGNNRATSCRLDYRKVFVNKLNLAIESNLNPSFPLSDEKSGKSYMKKTWNRIFNS